MVSFLFVGSSCAPLPVAGAMRAVFAKDVRHSWWTGWMEG